MESVVEQQSGTSITVEESLMSASTIANLPDEILRMIFSYFRPQQLCSQLAPVCSKFHRISRDTHFWKRLTLRNASLVAAISLFKTAPLQHLRKLRVDGWRDSGDALLALVSARCPSLKNFEHIGPSISVSGNSLDALAINCPLITKLALLDDDISDRKYASFAGFPNLETLSMMISLQSVTDVGALDNCIKLRYLNLRVKSPSGTEFIRAFIRKHAAKLRSFALKHQQVDEAACRTLPLCINLRKLSTNIVTESALTAIAANLKQLVNLKIFACSLLSSTALAAAFHSGANFPRLETLSLSNCRVVTDAVVIAVANRFGAQLKTLRLRHCDSVTGVGVSRVVARCSALETLTLDGVQNLTACLWSIPRCLPRLKYLSIKACQIAPETVAELKRSNPSLSIEC